MQVVNILTTMKRFLLFFLASFALFISCSKDSASEIPTPTPPSSAEINKIPISISTQITRATDTDFEKNDKVGLYVVNYNGSTPGTLVSSGNHVDNMRFTYSGSWTPDEEIYWKDESTKADFYTYYPYTASISNVAALPLSVETDQSSEANYKASDFLWGKTAGVAPTKNTVNMSMKHVMSNIIIKLVPGDGYKVEDLAIAKIEICGLKTNATVNLTNGEITATGISADITPINETTQYRALVIPQNVTDIDLVRIKIGDNTYLLNQTINLLPNRQYTSTITINRSSQGINIGIGEWEEDDMDYGGTVG